MTTSSLNKTISSLGCRYWCPNVIFFLYCIPLSSYIKEDLSFWQLLVEVTRVKCKFTLSKNLSPLPCLKLVFPCISIKLIFVRKGCGLSSHVQSKEISVRKTCYCRSNSFEKIDRPNIYHSMSTVITVLDRNSCTFRQKFRHFYVFIGQVEDSCQNVTNNMSTRGLTVYHLHSIRIYFF